VEQGLLRGEECSGEPLRDPVIEEERAHMEGVVERVLGESMITVEEDMRDRSVFPSFVSASPPSSDTKGNHTKTERLKYNEAFRRVVSLLMQEDPRVVYFGEDVSSKEGGVLGLTKGLLEEFGKGRIFNTPISEEAIAANAAGRALAGGKPICEFEFAPFFADAFPVFAHAIAPQWYQKKLKYDFTAIFPCGVVHNVPSAHYHESWPERFLLPMSGIAIVAPSNAYDLVGLMRAAHEFEGPVAMLLQISAAGMAEFISDIPDEPYSIPLGKAHVIREGSDFTVVAYGAACVAAARNEAEYLAHEGVSVEVIDMRTVHPWDTETIKRSIVKTGRFAVMHEDYASNGSVGEALVGKLLQDEDVLFSLKAMPVVVGAKYHFIPTASALAWDRLPYKRAHVEKEDERGRTLRVDIHRSPELALAVMRAFQYK
ncbi:MAG: transketolase C-terminal domain-containing protein, partial [Patescibacteria group bacterium]